MNNNYSDLMVDFEYRTIYNKIKKLEKRLAKRKKKIDERLTAISLNEICSKNA